MVILANRNGWSPYSLITSIVLLALALYICKPKLKSVLQWVVIVVCCILVGQGIKSVVKNSFQEPRPYVVWLEKEYGLSATEFYDLKESSEQTLSNKPLNKVIRFLHGYANIGKRKLATHFLLGMCYLRLAGHFY